jgi:hypothetical protein
MEAGVLLHSEKQVNDFTTGLNTTMKDKRKYCRIPFSTPVAVSWHVDGEARSAQATWMEISVDGLSIHVPEPIAEFTQVTLQNEELDFSGSALVRHVRPDGPGYTIGLELSPTTKDEILGLQTLERT